MAHTFLMDPSGMTVLIIGAAAALGCAAWCYFHRPSRGSDSGSMNTPLTREPPSSRSAATTARVGSSSASNALSYQCSYCSQLFATEAACLRHINEACTRYPPAVSTPAPRYQNEAFRAPRHVCTRCAREFSTEMMLLRHACNVPRAPSKDVAPVPAPRKAKLPPPPYDGIRGAWVPPEEFYGAKSFGVFQCTQCKAKWTSAHAQKRNGKVYEQSCKHCDDVWVPPKYMWQNEGTAGIRRVREEDDKPHLRELCEACQDGVCLQ